MRPRAVVENIEAAEFVGFGAGRTHRDATSKPALHGDNAFYAEGDDAARA